MEVGALRVLACKQRADECATDNRQGCRQRSYPRPSQPFEKALQALSRTARSLDPPPNVPLKGGRFDGGWAPQAEQIIQVFFHPRSSSYLIPQPTQTLVKIFAESRRENGIGRLRMTPARISLPEADFP
jgi:hypothetical protein